MCFLCRGAKGIQDFQVFQVQLGIEGRKDTGELLVLMVQKENRDLQETRGHQETEETLGIKVNQERKDRPVHLEKPETKALKAAEESTGKKANPAHQDRGGCRGIWDSRE